jgi:secreted protein with Ig-like and vWFA domain
MSNDRPTIAPVTPDPVPREPEPCITEFCELPAGHGGSHGFAAAAPYPMPPVDFAAIAEKHLGAAQEIAAHQAIHAAERAFLAAYRAHRDEMSRFLKMTSFDERWTVQCDATEASRVAHDEARTALDAADAAARDASKEGAK